MEISLPIFYTARLTKVRHKVARDYPMVGRIRVEIAEISAGEAPLAARLKRTITVVDNLNDDIKAQENEEINYRIYNGALIKPLQIFAEKYEQTFRFSEEIPRMPVYSENLQDILDEATHFMSLSPVDKALYEPKNRHILNDGSQTNFFLLNEEAEWSEVMNEENQQAISIWHSDNRREMEKRCREAVAQAAIVDGQVWTASLGPGWKLLFAWRNSSNADRDIIQLAPCSEISQLDDRCFPIMEREKSIEAAQAMLVGNRRIEENGSVEIFIPSIFKVAAERRHLTKAVKDFLDYTAHRIVLTSPLILRKYADAWELYDSLKIKNFLSQEEQENLLAAVVELSDAFYEHKGRKAESDRDNPLFPYLAERDKRLQTDQKEVDDVMLWEDDIASLSI